MGGQAETHLTEMITLVGLDLMRQPDLREEGVKRLTAQGNVGELILAAVVKRETAKLAELRTVRAGEPDRPRRQPKP